MKYGYVTIEIPLKYSEGFEDVKIIAEQIEQVILDNQDLKDGSVISYGYGVARGWRNS